MLLGAGVLLFCLGLCLSWLIDILVFIYCLRESKLRAEG